MAVPDTTTFSLQDVVNEVNPTTDDLVCCFSEADDGSFDDSYSGSKNSLLNFRNYGAVTYSVSCSPSSLTINAGATDSTTVTSSEDWTASLNSDTDDIISTYTTSGADGDTLSVTMELKDEGTYDTAIIRVSCGTASFDLAVVIIA